MNLEKKPGSGLPMREVVSLCICIVFALAGLSIVAPILPLIQEWQGYSYTQMGIFVSSFGFARMLMDLPSGVMVDRLDRKLVAIAGMGVTLTGCLVSAVAASFGILIAGRIIAGLGSAVAVSAIQTEMLLLAEQHNRSTAMSYFMLARRAGSSIYPFAGGLLSSLGGWRAIFYFMAAINLMGMLLSFLLLHPRKGSAATSGDEPSHRVEPKPAQQSPGLSFLLVLYFLSLILFLNRNGLEKSTIPLFGATIGLNSLQTGGVLSLSSLISLLAIAWSGRTADLYGRRRVLLAGLVLLLAANAAFLAAHNYATYLGAGLVFGLAAFTLGLPNVIIADVVPATHAGSSLGIARFFNDLGTVLGPVLLGWAMDSFSFSTSIWINVSFLAAGLLAVYLWLPEPGRQARRGGMPASGSMME